MCRQTNNANIETDTQQYTLDGIGQNIERVYNFLQQQANAKDELIVHLHDELETYKKGESGRFENQLLKAIIRIHRSMKKAFTGANFAAMDADQLRQLYQYTFEDLTDMLQQQGCDEFTSRPGDMFDPSIHLPRTEETDDPTLDHTVKQSIKSGFRKGTKTLVPEQVIVYRLKKTEDNAT